MIPDILVRYLSPSEIGILINSNPTEVCLLRRLAIERRTMETFAKMFGIVADAHHT